MAIHQQPPGNRNEYHHGNLRDQLISTARLLIRNNGSEHFKVADACRDAGVSTAAPYRHFADRNALLVAVAITGFHDLRDEARAAGALHKKGSVKAVSAIGRAYVEFASREPNLFRLMFGQSSVGTDEHIVQTAKPTHSQAEADIGVDESANAREVAGRECYEVLLEQLVVTLKRKTIDDKVIQAAFPLWTFVHGLSFLTIDGNLSVNQMPIDIVRQIDSAAKRLMP